MSNTTRSTPNRTLTHARSAHTPLARLATLGGCFLAQAACGGPIDSDAATIDGSAIVDASDAIDSNLNDAAVDTAPDASSSDGSSPDASTGTDYIPYLASDYTRVFVPAGTNYLNDHTIVHDPMRDEWHLIGITASGPANPFDERELLHATSHSLTGPWVQDVPVLTARSDLDESFLWAPYVFATSATRWTMLYEGGSNLRPVPERELRRADSSDLTTWTRQEEHAIDAASRVPGGRDPFAIRIGDEWWIYSVGVRWSVTDFFGQILVTRIHDLDDANEVAHAATSVVLEDPVSVPSIGWGNLESPFVVFYEGKYYLFVTRTGTAQTDYVRTVVFRSDDPAHFAWEPITQLFSHAAEIVHDGDRWYITSAGWTANVGESNRGLLIAPLQWAPQ